MAKNWQAAPGARDVRARFEKRRSNASAWDLHRVRLRSASSLFYLRTVMKQLDLSGKVTVTTTYEQLMTLRDSLVDPALRMFMDKIEFKKYLGRIGVAHTPTLFMSNERPPWNLAQYVDGREDYVVKPVHFSMAGYAFLVQDGRTQWATAVGP